MGNPIQLNKAPQRQVGSHSHVSIPYGESHPAEPDSLEAIQKHALKKFPSPMGNPIQLNQRSLMKGSSEKKVSIPYGESHPAEPSLSRGAPTAALRGCLRGVTKIIAKHKDKNHHILYEKSRKTR